MPLLRTIGGQNEDTTRLRAINTILFDVLRWDRAQTETERYVRAAGYADYVFGTEPAFSLVLEAKREGVAFVLSNDVPADRPVPFDLLAGESPSAADALRQATGYAVQLGAPYVAISNGHQWLLALTFVHGRPIESRSVLAFASLDRISDNFRYFWATFSPLAIQTHAPTPLLLESRFDPPPPKLSTQISNYPQPADRNVLRNELSAAIEPLWADVTQRDTNDDFLRNCYIKPDDRAEDFDLARHLIRRARPLDGDVGPEPAAIPSTQVTAFVADTAFVTHKPIVVLGRVGHGKSIFLQYLRRIDAASELRDYLQIDVDFLDRPDTCDEVPDYIYREIDRQLLNDYNIDIQSDAFARAVLNLELIRFRSSTRAKLLEADSTKLAQAEAEKLDELQRDRHTYFAHALRHLRKGQKKSLAIFFDNLDRRDDRIQEAAFLRASAIARDWEPLLFICLRPGTFQRSRANGVLDAVAPRIITVSPPRTDAMLRRRFTYAAQLAATGAELASSAASARDTPPGETSDLLKAKQFFEICEESFHRNKELADLFTAVSNANARSILHYVQQVIRSGHLNTQKIFAIAAEQGSYTIATHEALRALLYADHNHYDPSTSLFLNLFDIEHADPREHFSRFLMLDYFARAASGDNLRGYRQCDSVHSYLHSLAYTGPHINATLHSLYDRKCLEGRVLDVPFDEAGTELRITALGRYHITALVRTFVYLDAVVVDTPILDAQVRRGIADVTELRPRLSRARAFLRYLNQSAQELHDGNAIALWNDVHDAIESDIRRLETEATQ
jgi:hypothetical protein